MHMQLINTWLQQLVGMVQVGTSKILTTCELTKELGLDSPNAKLSSEY